MSCRWCDKPYGEHEHTTNASGQVVRFCPSERASAPVDDDGVARTYIDKMRRMLHPPSAPLATCDEPLCEEDAVQWQLDDDTWMQACDRHAALHPIEEDR